MTDINDDYSPHDAADEARAEDPPDDYGQRPPLDLDDLQKLYDLAEEPGGLPAWGRIVYLRVPDLIAALREAHERIAGFEALPTREEWVVTGGPNFPAEPSGPPVSPDKGVIAYVNRHATAQLWRRKFSVHPWEPISPDAPF